MGQPTNLNLDEATVADLDAYARQEERSRSNAANRLLRDALDRVGVADHSPRRTEDAT